MSHNDSLHTEYQGLFAMVGDLKASIERVGGKVDMTYALLEKQSDRQDRHEARVDRLEAELDRVREKSTKDLKDLEDKANDRFSAINWRIAMGVGGVSVLAAFLPLLLKLVGFA